MTDLLSLFHREVRLPGEDRPTPGVVLDRDGPVRRRYPVVPGASYSMVESPEGLGPDPVGVIDRQAAFFQARGERVEWKTYSYDEPPDLVRRLARAGFVAEDVEALVLGELAALVTAVTTPPGVTLRQATSERDLRRLGVLTGAVFGRGALNDAMTDDLVSTWKQDPSALAVVLVEEGPEGPVLCGARVDLSGPGPFVGLWGGATLPAWRGRGLYRAVTAYRSELALARGYRYARVDASPDSRPILERLGLHVVATTTPCVLDARDAAQPPENGERKGGQAQDTPS